MVLPSFLTAWLAYAAQPTTSSLPPTYGQYTATKISTSATQTSLKPIVSATSASVVHTSVKSASSAAPTSKISPNSVSVPSSRASLSTLSTVSTKSSSGLLASSAPVSGSRTSVNSLASSTLQSSNPVSSGLVSSRGSSASSRTISRAASTTGAVTARSSSATIRNASCSPTSSIPPYTSTVTSTFFTFTGTTITTTYAPTVIETVYQSSFTVEYIFSTVTVITTYTYPQKTKTILSAVSPTATVTVPTPAGFTPIECGTDYFRSFTTSTVLVNGFGDTSLVAVPGPSTSTYTYTSIVYTTTIVSTIPITWSTDYVPTPATVTSTRSALTTTQYDACETNNVTPNYPQPGSYLYFAYLIGNSTASVVDSVSVPALDARDCCQICQGTPECAGSQFANLDNATIPTNCKIFVKNSNAGDLTCDPAFIGEQSTYHTLDIRYYLSNGPCGRVDIPLGYPIAVDSTASSGGIPF